VHFEVLLESSRFGVGGSFASGKTPLTLGLSETSLNNLRYGKALAVHVRKSGFSPR